MGCPGGIAGHDIDVGVLTVVDGRGLGGDQLGAKLLHKGGGPGYPVDVGTIEAPSLHCLNGEGDNQGNIRTIICGLLLKVHFHPGVSRKDVRSLFPAHRKQLEPA